MENSSLYTTDDKVKWYSTEEEINSKLSSIIGKKFEDYREKWDAANRFELETDFPLFLQVETHQICNLKCPSCPIGIPEAYDKYISSEKMDWDIYQKIILEGESYGCPSIEPQGTNEPFLDKNLENYIKFASDHGFIDILSDEASADIITPLLKNSRTSLIAAKKSMNKCYLESDRKKQRFIELGEYKKTLNSPERKEALKKYKKK